MIILYQNFYIFIAVFGDPFIALLGDIFIATFGDSVNNLFCVPLIIPICDFEIDSAYADNSEWYAVNYDRLSVQIYRANDNNAFMVVFINSDVWITNGCSGFWELRVAVDDNRDDEELCYKSERAISVTLQVGQSLLVQ